MIDLHPAAKEGFTLLELLVAITMTAMLTLAVYGTYRAVSSSAEIYEKTIHYHEMAIACLERMNADLQSIAIRSQSEYVSSKDPKKADPLMIRIHPAFPNSEIPPETPILQLTSRNSLPLSPSDLPGIVEIRYEMIQEETGGWALRRSQSNLPFSRLPEMKTEPVVCRELRFIEIVAMDAEGKHQKQWNSNAKEQLYETPAAVMIRLGVGEGAFRVNAETLVRLPVNRSTGKS